MYKLLRAAARRIGTYECVAFITGFVLMAFELAASRILAPTIGTSTYVWTSVIGAMIAALAAGYAAGGWLADNRADKTDIVWLLLMSALTVLITCIFYEDTLSTISSLIHDPRLQGVIASIILFVPTSFLLGMTSPYLARLRIHSVQTTGRSVAGLSASNSVGGIVGTFFTGFVFFTIIGSRQTMVLLALILIACSWLVVPLEQRRTRIITSIALFAVLMLQLTMPVRASIVASIDTASSHYTIRDISLEGKPVRVLIMGPGGWQTGVYLDGSDNLAFDYTRKLANVVAAAPHKDKVLILGGGAFSLPEYLGKQYPKSTIDVVEIDPELPKIAKKYFGYKPTPNVRTFTEDARTYLKNTADRYDIIVVDVYNDASVPFALTTREYTAALKNALVPDGIITANIIAAATPDCMPLLASIHGSYASSFRNSAYYPLLDLSLQTEQNIVAVYSNHPLDWTSVMPGNISVRFNSGRDLTDDYAPIEYLKQQCSNK